MQLECTFFAPFREAVGTKTISYETDVSAVRDLLAELEAEYPDLEGKILADGGDELVGSAVVTIDDKNIRRLEGLDTELQDGASIQFAQSIHGG